MVDCGDAFAHCGVGPPWVYQALPYHKCMPRPQLHHNFRLALPPDPVWRPLLVGKLGHKESLFHVSARVHRRSRGGARSSESNMTCDGPHLKQITQTKSSHEQGVRINVEDVLRNREKSVFRENVVSSRGTHSGIYTLGKCRIKLQHLSIREKIRVELVIYLRQDARH